MNWVVYMVRCEDGSLYTGVTTNVERRLMEHNGSKRGARYTRARRPVSLAYAIAFEGKGAAQHFEAAVKRLPKPTKEYMAARWRVEKAT